MDRYIDRDRYIDSRGEVGSLNTYIYLFIYIWEGIFAVHEYVAFGKSRRMQVQGMEGPQAVVRNPALTTSQNLNPFWKSWI